MQMVDGLTGVQTLVKDEPIAVYETLLLGDLRGGVQEELVIAFGRQRS